MFTKKTSDREKLDSSDYTIQEMHTRQRPENLWANTNYIQFGAYDPGIVNFGIRFERRYSNGLIVGLLYARIKPYDIRKDKNSENYKGNVSTLYASLTEFLVQHHDIVAGCHYHLIERQLKDNPQSCRVQQHVQTYLATVFRNAPLMPYVIEVDAKLKGRLLGLPKQFNKPAAKKWGAAKALELLKLRGDQSGVDEMMAATKTDDLGDVVCMIEAMCIVLGYPTTIPYNPIIDDGSDIKQLEAVIDANYLKLNDQPLTAAVISNYSSDISLEDLMFK